MDTNQPEMRYFCGTGAVGTGESQLKCSMGRMECCKRNAYHQPRPQRAFPWLAPQGRGWLMTWESILDRHLVYPTLLLFTYFLIYLFFHISKSSHIAVKFLLLSAIPFSKTMGIARSRLLGASISHISPWSQPFPTKNYLQKQLSRNIFHVFSVIFNQSRAMIIRHTLSYRSGI